MEYQLKKQEIISNVEFTNLLSFSLVENKLQRNFRVIVQALMLNQAKTDTINQDHLQVKQNHSKEILKINTQLEQMNQQLANLQHLENNNDHKSSIHSIPKIQSHKQVEPISSKKTLQKNTNQSDDTQNTKSMWDQMNQKMNHWQNKWDEQKSDLIKQIQNMKDKLDSVGFLQNQLKNFRVDLRIVKDELTNNIKNQSPQSLKHNNSNKSIAKRQSILNMISAKATDKGIQQTSKNTLKNLSKEENKENVNGMGQNKTEQNQQNSFNLGVEKQINLLYLELNTIKVSFEELRDLLSDSRKQTFKNTNVLSELKDDLNRQIKTRKTETEDLENAIKDIKMQMLNVETLNTNQTQEQEKGLKESAKTNKLIKKDEDDVNHKNQLNDKISKMQAMMQNMITSTEFNRLKNGLNDQIERLTNNVEGLEQNLQNSQKKLEDLIIQYQVNTNSDLGELRNRMNDMEQTMKNESNQNERKNNILNAKIQELKKSLQNLREDIEFYQSLNTQNTKEKSEKKSQESPNISENAKILTAVDDKALEALKKYFSGKMHDLRTNLLGLIRDLEKKLNTKSNGEQEVVKIWDRLNELNLFMNKKADQDDTKKTFIYLEKKINRLNTVMFKNQDNTDDARIARSNQWQCLSCDKNLHSYQGKIGKHMVWDSMPLKGINKSFINQTDDKKKGLPQLKK